MEDKNGKGLKKYINRLIEKDGFYVILFICVCIVATTAVWVTKENISKYNAKEENAVIVQKHGINHGLNRLYEFVNETSNKGVVKINKQSKVTEENNKNTNEKLEESEDKFNKEQKKNAITATNIEAQEKKEIKSISMVIPLMGKISKNFAKDTLVYSKTLEQWSTHKGIDIKAKQGTVVRASLKGVVKEIKKEDELGIVITLDHGDGLITKYGCLSTDDMVKVGETIKKGDPISGVGEGVGFELAQGPHLHFEVLLNGENVDPKEYIPKFK
ncbi:MAG: M23 family metallopeptidase [Firmicutes bacterium]|nr:M23 family metallopeptidase [Bacillota bacterium]